MEKKIKDVLYGDNADDNKDDGGSANKDGATIMVGLASAYEEFGKESKSLESLVFAGHFRPLEVPGKRLRRSYTTGITLASNINLAIFVILFVLFFGVLPVCEGGTSIFSYVL